jgi:hypothetical protein
VRLDGAQHRQPAGGQGEVGELDQRVAAALRGGALVAGAAGRGGDGLDRGGQLLPADGVQDEGAGPGALQQSGHRERPALGGVGLGAVRVEPGGVEVHRRAQP